MSKKELYDDVGVQNDANDPLLNIETKIMQNDWVQIRFPIYEP